MSDASMFFTHFLFHVLLLPLINIYSIKQNVAPKKEICKHTIILTEYIQNLFLRNHTRKKVETI